MRVARPLLSIVSVFNRRNVFRGCLQASVNSQSAAVELIGVDNSDARFDRATAALNWGGRQASGDWIVFAHQDIVLTDRRWTSVVHEALQSLQPSGWCGLVGRDDRGRWQGLIRDRDGVYGEPFAGARNVQTLDEIVLIHRRLDDETPYFDETLTGWHAYGVEACCRSILAGHQNHVISAPVWHDSPSTNRQGLQESHAMIQHRFSDNIPRIYTTCGEVPVRFRSRGSYRAYVLKHEAIARVHQWRCGTPLLSFSEVPRPMDLLDNWTAGESLVDCLRGDAWYDKIEAIGFSDATANPRTVKHWFGNWQPVINEADVIVIGPEVCRRRELPEINCRRLITAETLPRNRHATAIAIHGRSCIRREVCRDQDDRYMLISEYGAA